MHQRDSRQHNDCVAKVTGATREIQRERQPGYPPVHMVEQHVERAHCRNGHDDDVVCEHLVLLQSVALLDLNDNKVHLSGCD